MNTIIAFKRCYFFVIFICFVWFTQTCQASDQNDSLGEINPSKVSHQHSSNKLLEKVDPTPAEEEMTKIIHYLTYMQGEEYKQAIHKEVVPQYKELQNLSKEKLEIALRDRAWGVALNGSLNDYLGTLLEKIEELQKAYIEQGETISSRENQIKELQEANQPQIETISLLEKQNEAYKAQNKQLQTIASAASAWAIGTTCIIAWLCWKSYKK